MIGFAKRPATKLIVIHCSKTSPYSKDTDSPLGGYKYLEEKHRIAGAACCGYHFVIERSGVAVAPRPHWAIGNHALGHNEDSIGICLIGGADKNGREHPNYTNRQWSELNHTLDALRRLYPDAEVVGHRDIDVKENFCPSFDVAHWLATQETRPILKETSNAAPPISEATDPRPPEVG